MWNIPCRPEQERISGVVGGGNKVDLRALLKQLKDCPVEESLDLLGLASQGGIRTFTSDDSDGEPVLT